MSETVQPKILYRVKFKFRPGKDHPAFWECEWGLVFLLLSPVSGLDIKERAKAIMAQLPFEIIDDCVVELWDKPTYFQEEYRLDTLCQLGFAHYIMRVPVEEFSDGSPEALPWGKPVAPESGEEWKQGS